MTVCLIPYPTDDDCMQCFDKYGHSFICSHRTKYGKGDETDGNLEPTVYDVKNIQKDKT